jgi:hypothetical protein
MDTHAGEQPRGSNVFRLFALFVLARVVIDLPERLAPAFRNVPTGDFYEFAAKYQDYLDTAYLLLVVVVVCICLRRSGAVIVHSDLAPLGIMLAFALLLPAIRQLLADLLMTIASLVVVGNIGSTRGFDRQLAVEPARMIWHMILGIGAALVWCALLKRIFGPDLEQVVRRGIKPVRRMWLLGPLFLYAIALPVLNGIGSLAFDATRQWFPYWYGLNYLTGMCILAAFLYAVRDRLKRWELSPLVIVLAFVLLAELAHHLIDREILHAMRTLSKEQMPWEETLRLRRPINFVATAIYQTVLIAIGAAAAYGVLGLIFGSGLAPVVRRVAPPPAGAAN